MLFNINCTLTLIILNYTLTLIIFDPNYFHSDPNYFFHFNKNRIDMKLEKLLELYQQEKPQLSIRTRV